MNRTRRINILPFIKFQTVFWGLIGLFMGILYSFGGLFIDTLVTLGWVSTDETPGLSYGSLLAFGALIGMPILFAAFGLVSSFVGALLFNLCSKWLGWVKIDFVAKNR